jgi:hypothetical protein
MREKIIKEIESLLPALHSKAADSSDTTFITIANQLEFIKDCLMNNKDILKELDGRELNFNVIASRNLAGPDEDLQKKISHVGLLLSKL